MNKKRQHLRPGPGWKHLGGSVWEHAAGLRIHTLGFYLHADDGFVSGNAWPESRTLSRFTRINGGNRKRGVMAWALSSLD